MNEIWKDIDEFAGLYQVSNLGRVRRIGSYSNQNSSWDLKEPKMRKITQGIKDRVSHLQDSSGDLQ